MSKGQKPAILRLPQVAITLADGNKPPARVQLLKAGTYHDPRYGKFKVTEKMLASMIKNFDANVLKIDLAIDYAHESDKVAAGWIKKLAVEASGTELWADVDWTPRGEKVLSEREFRYLSADYTENYIDNETLREHGPTLRGAGLTNRPVIKGMDAAVQLQEGNEDMAKTIDELEAENKKLADEKKAAEDAKAAAEAEKAKLAKELADKKAGDGDGDDDEKMTPEQMKKKLKEQQKKLDELMSEKKCGEMKAEFDKKLSEGKVVEAQREPFMKGDMAKFIELAQPVNLQGKGHGKEVEKKDGDVDTRIVKAAEKVLAEKKASTMADAISRVLSENIDGLRVEKHGK